MGEPMALQSMFFGTMAGAAVVLMGACYALFFALGRLHESRWFHAACLACYALLCAATYVLVMSFELAGFWLIVAAVMLLGYFLLPRAIWHLCVGTHADEPTPSEPRAIP